MNNPLLRGEKRSELSKKIWRKRKRGPAKGTCAFCGRKIFAGGVLIQGKKMHKGCAEAWHAGLRPKHIGRNPRKGLPDLHEAVIRDIKAAKKMVPLGYTQIKRSDAEYIARKYNLPVEVIMRASKYLNPKGSTIRREPRDAYRFYGASPLSNPLWRISIEGGNMSIVEAKTKTEAMRKAKSSVKDLYGRQQTPDILSIRPATEEDIGWFKGVGGTIWNPQKPKYGHIDGITRSEVSKKTWASRKRAGGKGRCFYCGRNIYAGGVRYKGRLYHETCASLMRKGVPIIKRRLTMVYNPRIETRPPREWFAKMLPGLRASYPKATMARLGKISSGIWWRFTQAQREAFRKSRRLPSGLAANPAAYVRGLNGLPLDSAGSPLTTKESAKIAAEARRDILVRKEARTDYTMGLFEGLAAGKGLTAIKYGTLTKAQLDKIFRNNPLSPKAKARMDYLYKRDKQSLQEIVKRSRKVVDLRGVSKSGLISMILEDEFGRKALMNPLLPGERYLGRTKRGVSKAEAKRRGWL